MCIDVAHFKHKTSETIELLRKENWRNKAKSTKKKSFYQVDYPEIISKFQSKFKHSIDNIRNGNYLKPSPIRIGTKTILYRFWIRVIWGHFSSSCNWIYWFNNIFGLCKSHKKIQYCNLQNIWWTMELIQNSIKKEPQY